MIERIFGKNKEEGNVAVMEKEECKPDVIISDETMTATKTRQDAARGTQPKKPRPTLTEVQRASSKSAISRKTILDTRCWRSLSMTELIQARDICTQKITDRKDKYIHEIERKKEALELELASLRSN